MSKYFRGVSLCYKGDRQEETFSNAIQIGLTNKFKSAMSSFPTCHLGLPFSFVDEVLFFRQKLIPQTHSWGEMSG